MGLFSKLFSADESEPTEGQIRRAIKQVIQMHGEAATRVGAMERLAEWRTQESAAALLRRFTVQTPQASMDLEEKQYAVTLLAQMGEVAVKPILSFLKTEPDVAFPIEALRKIYPPEKFFAALLEALDALAGGFTRWPEAKTVMISSLGDEAFSLVGETVSSFLDDADDDVCIAAADYLARAGDDSVRDKLLAVYLAADSRPRIRARILEHFCDRAWDVKDHKKEVEAVIAPPFYLTAKGAVKRRG